MNYAQIFAALLWVNIALAVLVVIGERKNPRSTLIWLMTLVFLPGVGYILYLWLGRDLRKEKRFNEKAYRDKRYTHMIESLKDQLKSGQDIPALSGDGDVESIVRMHLFNSDAALRCDNVFQPIFTGEDYFARLFLEMERATRYIYFQTYIMRSDHIGTQLVDLLIAKARKGVTVKFLIDGMGGRAFRKRDIARMRRAGVHVEVFFPFFIPYISPRMNYRNHRKICVIDDAVGFVGGFNVGDEYIDGGKAFASWRDAAILIRGGAVADLKFRFALDFSFAVKKPATAMEKDVEWSIIGDPPVTGEGCCQVVTSGPDSYWPSIKDGFAKMIQTAKHRIFIETPYFIPDDAILESLKIAALSGVEVSIMLPSKGDHPFVLWASLSFVGELLQAGVRCFLYHPGFQHAKVVVMDEDVVSIGTANMDMRSFRLNFEANLFLYHEGIAKRYADRFLFDAMHHCTEITPAVYARRSLRVKAKESVSRLFSPLL